MKVLEFKPSPGAAVQLKSDGFPMTVESVDGSDVTCVWSDKGRIRREVLKAYALKRSTAGVDKVLIIQGWNATAEEIDEHQALGEAFGNA